MCLCKVVYNAATGERTQSISASMFLRVDPILLIGLSLVFLFLPLTRALYSQRVHQRRSPEHTNLRGLQPSILLSDSKHLAMENLPCISVCIDCESLHRSTCTDL